MHLSAHTEMISVGNPSRQIRVARWIPEGAAPRAAVLLLNGLSEFLDKYEEVASDLLARNLLVLSLDWGGQGLSDRLLDNRHKTHTTDYAHRLEEVQALIAWGEEAMGDLPTITLAHSMGGHIALRKIAENPPPRLRALALSAPMVSIKIPSWFAGPVSSIAGAFGLAERYAPMAGDYDYDAPVKIPNSVTSDAVRGHYQPDAIKRNRDLAVGGITWGWMQASQMSIAHLRKPGVLENIKCPTMFGMAGNEKLVSNSAIKQAVKRMPDATLTEHPGALHEILMERDPIRNRFFDDFDALLARAGL